MPNLKRMNLNKLTDLCIKFQYVNKQYKTMLNFFLLKKFYLEPELVKLSYGTSSLQIDHKFEQKKKRKFK